MTDRSPPTKDPKKPSDTELIRETDDRFRAQKALSRTVTGKDDTQKRKTQRDLEERAEQEEKSGD